MTQATCEASHPEAIVLCATCGVPAQCLSCEEEDWHDTGDCYAHGSNPARDMGGVQPPQSETGNPHVGDGIQRADAEEVLGKRAYISEVMLMEHGLDPDRLPVAFRTKYRYYARKDVITAWQGS